MITAAPTALSARASTFIELTRSCARPFTQYVITIAFAVGMFLKADAATMAMAVGLLGYHGYLRTRDKQAELSTAGAPADAGQAG